MTTKVSAIAAFAMSLAVAVFAESGGTAAPLQQLQGLLHSFDERRSYEGPPLTLDGALDEALEKNPTLIALRRQFEVARLRPAQERFLMPPTFEAQIWQWPISSINPLDTNMYMLTAGQDIPGRGKRRARAAVLEKEAAVAESQIAVRAREVVDEVKRVYAELFLARAEIDVRLANIELLRQFADVSEAKYATGRISQQDVLKAVVELSKVHDDLVVIDERARLAEAQLNALLDRAPDAPIGPIGPPRERVVLPAASDLQRIALELQPELRAAALERERAEAALGAARAEYKPDFFVGGGYMLTPRDRGAWTATVGITWPNAPWSRGRLDARVAEARAEIGAATARQRAVENGIRLAVQQAYVRVQAAVQRAGLLRTSIVPQSEQTLEVSRVAYQTDRVDFLALIDNQRVLLEAQLAYYGALSDLEQALADLERAVGTELEPGATPGLAVFVQPEQERRTR
ncbi:MAG: TolC family protein [Acidobacteria bacterium]|nr:TolC family protein [Acidobacteriota bacterium]